MDYPAAMRTRGTSRITLPGSGMSQAEMLRALDDETLTAALEDESFSPALVNAEIRRRQSAAPPPPRAMRGNPRGAAGPGRVPELEIPGVSGVLRNIGGIASRRRDDVAEFASSADDGIRDIMSGVRNRVGSKIQSLRASFPEVQNPAAGLIDRIARNRRDAKRSEMEPGTTEGDYGSSAPPPVMQLPAGAVAGDYGPVPQDDSGKFDPQPDITPFAGEEPPLMEEAARASEDGSVLRPPSALSAISLYRDGGVNPAVLAAAGRPPTSSAAAAGLPVAPGLAPRGAAAPAAAAVAEPGATRAAADEAEESQSAYNTASDAARKRIAEILDAQKNAGISDKDRWLSLALGGARMAASRNPYFLGAAGEGAAAGLEDYTAKDKLAKDQARAETSQRLQGEQMAESAGDRAERRVIQKQDSKFKHLDRQDRNAARAEELRYRYAELQQRANDNQLTREERAAAMREANETRLEIAKLYAGSREAIAAGNQAVSLERAQIAAQARRDAVKQWAPEPLQKALDVWERNKDDPELAATAWARVQKVSGVKSPAEIERMAQNLAMSQLRGELTPPRDTEAYLKEKSAKFKEMLSAGAASMPAAAPKPAAAPAATGEWGIKKKAE